MNSSTIAIVGMAGRFPGARNTAEFWQNLRDGVESIRDLTEAELLVAGATVEDLANPDYVRRAAILDGVKLFDASFFGFSPRDAAIMDPQHRHFLECAWEALEDAAHPPQQFSGSIGVFAGSGMNTYLIHNLLANRRLVASAGLFQLKQTGNDKDVLATRVSYQLDLRGPSINVQTACSTSLVAVHMACQSLLNFECDMALAGGVTIEIPHGLGYMYREGEILSRDGHCRSFDANSSGTVFASGLGIVVLRRLEDALADRDHIRAVILGSAINNDGARKVGYLAPSVEGQAEVIREALGYAGVPASSISYVETHGTGTRMGDPIEVRALTQAFRKSGARGTTAIGSLKSNVGHLDAAAGVAGLIKTVLALEHAQIPASLHFEKINPHIELEGSPFYVSSKLADWPTGGTPRRAGVTSLGIGGTNAHVIVEEAPAVSLTREQKPYQILTVSAKTEAAADLAFANLAAHLGEHPELNLADVAFTCQLGRTVFPHRRAVVVEDTRESIAALAGLNRKKIIAGPAGLAAPAFFFSGEGSQHVNVGRELHEQESVSLEALDVCAKHLREPREIGSAFRCALETLGRLWTLGVDVDWMKLHAAGSVQRVSLPTYPFERQKFWIEPDTIAKDAQPAPVPEMPSENAVSAGEAVSLYRRVWTAAPLGTISATEPSPWLLFRDAFGVADEIARYLKAAKQNFSVVEFGGSFKRLGDSRYALRSAARADYDALVAALLESGRVLHKIVHLWSLAAEASEAPLEETLDRSFFSPLYLAQALAAQDLEGVQLALVSNYMQQVDAEPVRNPARAVLLGPARVVHKELPGFNCKAIDLDLDGGKAAESAAQIVAEMNGGYENTTIAWRGGERFIERLEPLELSAAHGHSLPGQARLERGGVYLITGGLGALGLTAAEHLARQFQAHLVLVGRSALPPEAQWESALQDGGRSDAEKERLRKLVAIRSLAASLLVLQADVTKLDEMKAAVAQARRQFGKINGVFHAAGLLDDGLLMLKTAASARRVLDPKVRGTLVLEEALRDEPLACFVLFSSVSSILPPAGQVDYAAANAFLDAFALSRKALVTAINWGAWREIGMAARAISPHPWLGERLLDSPNEIVYADRFSQQRRWVLAEHRFKNGIALIPGTGHLEMVAGAFTRGSLQGAIEFCDVFFLAPLMFSPDESKEVRVQLRREQSAEAAKGAFRFSVFACDGRWVEYCTGIIAPCHSRPATAVDRAAIAARCRVREIDFDEQNRTRQERQFEFGPRWRSLRRLHLGKGEGLAEIELDENFSADVAALRQHPALLDMATGAALYLTDDYDHCDDLFLPISYRRMTVYRSFPARMYSHFRGRKENQRRSEVETFDVTIFDEQGQVLAEIESFAVRRIADLARAVKASGLAHEVTRSGGEQFIEIDRRPGISPLEGARVLTRILLAEAPTAVVVVPQPLEAFESSIAAPPRKPTAEAASVAAAESIELTLVGWWQELLGVDQVSSDDDFFALGGHSLIGVRLLAKIKKVFHVDLELAVLFEARTPGQLAEVIRKASAPASGEQRTWSALVPIQPNGSRVPLFCIHAVGGDVLFYEQLAKALGPNQPFYAFQSPLIADPDRRDLTVEKMAALYIKEMRAFFPQGPYLLGAASYGGFVLYEMARQLQEQGVTPAAVIMFDVRVPDSDQNFGMGIKLAKFLRNIREGGARYLSKKIGEKSEYYWSRFMERAVFPASVKAFKMIGRPLSPALRFHWISQGHWYALSRYFFKPFPGKITLVRATDQGPEVLGRRDDLTLGWGNLAQGGVEIVDVPTKHMLMLFEPYVASFAETLKTILPT
ncbi:MAG: SDR family NAD(P)-dependent oxidoreductase [Terracidiphilus sp.]|nr:SDR family NAD(P)-dependent oxidoreductase [Terracidiphilus sp.]MDR3798600.1 SDR family NAD(P)-dependent oxidoreductase [Terracidiphilus sp.]